MPKKSSYIYKLVSKYRKHPELLLKYGFNYYTDEKNEETIFAYPIKLSHDNPLFKQCVHFLEHCYKEATPKEREEDFKDYEFKDNELILTEKVAQEFEGAQLCVSINDREPESTYLFINSPIQNAYYHYETVKECAPELIETLLKDKVIYARRYIYNSR